MRDTFDFIPAYDAPGFSSTSGINLSMKQTQLCTHTKKDAPKDEVARNAQLLIRGGFIHKEMAGVYSYLPLGLRVIKKIEEIIRQEMNAIGGQEIVMTALQEKEVWEKTGRWDDAVVDTWFKTRLKNDTELGLAYTHEPAITALMKDYISSYRDLPAYLYQFQTKFRNELRAKSGLFRGREFIMKDLYSFSRTDEELNAFYEKVITAYQKIFVRVGIGDRTYMTLASGGTFGTAYSHEFQTLTAAGEDTIYVHKGKNIAVNKEVLNDDTLRGLNITEDELVEEKSIEVGNIYKLGTFYSKPLNLVYTAESGAVLPAVMGSYGIGVGRLMGTITEVLSHEKGIYWPKEVAPFAVHMISLCRESVDVHAAEALYAEFILGHIEVLYDDRDVRAGEKFADADLLGIPIRIVVSEKTLAHGMVEVRGLRESDTELVKKEDLLACVSRKV